MYNTCISLQVVYSASHIDTIPDTLASSIASMTSSVQHTYSTSSTMAPNVIPSLDPATMVMNEGGQLVSGAEAGGTLPNAMLGQSEVVSQIQGAIAGIQDSLMGQSGGAAAIPGNVLGQNEGGGATIESSIAGQGTVTAPTSIPESMIAQSDTVGGDTIQDSIQDSIMGQGSSNSGGASGIPALLPQNVSDIASQLISQYVSQPVTSVFQPTATTSHDQEPVESMQTDVTPQPATSAPSVSS